jgi:hypothetical protein
LFEKNFENLKESCEEYVGIEFEKMEKKRNILKSEKKWEEETKELKDEKKSMGYMVFNRMRDSDVNKENIKIKQVSENQRS